MDTGNPQKPEDGRLFPAKEPPIIIEPLKVKRPSRTVREVEALVVGIQVALVTELNSAKQEVLDAICQSQARRRWRRWRGRWPERRPQATSRRP